MSIVGIFEAKIKPSKAYTVFNKGSIDYIEMSVLSNSIEAFVDESCLGALTENPQDTLKKVQWIVIDEIVWDRVLSEYNRDKGVYVYGNSEILKKLKPHILYSAAGKSIKFNLGLIEKHLTAGNVYLLMPFTQYPEKKYPKQNLRLVYVKAPHIRYVYVDPPSLNEADIPVGYDNKLHLYGMNARVNVSNHLFPDFREPKNNNKTCILNGEIFFINDENQEIIVGNFRQTVDVTSYNSYKDFTVFIDPLWRETEGTHKIRNQSQKYYIKAYAHISDKESFSITQKNTFYTPLDFREMLVSSSYNTRTDFRKWFRFDTELNNWIELPMQAYIEVRWDTMEMIYRQFEKEKTKQIQYIGDITYKKKEFDPCGYSTITIKDESDAKRKPLVIFDEDAAVIDQTSRYFEVTTGDKAKRISVKLGNLKHKAVFCQGLMLKNNQKHDVLTNVFQLENSTFSAKKSKDDKYYETTKDEDHQNQLKNAGTPITEQNKNDTDVIRNDDNSRIRSVKDVMRWEKGKNYDFKGDDEVWVDLKYRYNKTLTISNTEFNPNVVGNLFEEAWLFNYLWLDINKHKQVYYLPIGTCRYPNQIAKINVLPDMKWTLLFKFNFKEEDFKKFKEEHSYEVRAYAVQTSETVFESGPDGTRAAQRNTSAAGVRLTRTTTVVPVERRGGVKRLLAILKRIEVSLTAEWKDEEGKKQDKDVIEGFAKQIYNFFSKISDIAKLVGSLAEGDSNETDSSNKKQLEDEIEKMKGGRSLDGAWDVLTKKTQETEILYPSIAIAASWYYADADDPARPELMGRKSLQIDAKLEASPIIGVEIKWNFIEMLARKHPLAFIIKKAVDLALYLLDPRNGVELTFTLSGEIGLTANFKHNMLAGNAYSNGRSPKKEELISGSSTVKADLKGSIVSYTTTYLIISEYKSGGEAKLGIKTELTNKVYLGADTDGMYLANDTSFDGFTFYMEAEYKLEITVFGVKIIDWNPKYDPEPLNWGKCSMEWMKVYLNNPDKKTEFATFKTGDDE